ncbi:DUF2007 domain-containing protein [Algimonas porphyrae]|uniref:DUF2007 domain-containing protein n=2 Tax=Algimonas porphyrae TaxID=1128113 RepID=A0ABQ5UZ28_9PROT|nr:DUF2007 domain-containing protein [Algimonas porphyrae]GLQ20169.1 hypothetical protein GCM10007854_11240 [Algimonas porphyrae]
MADVRRMIALIVTTDPATIAFAQAVLRDAEIECYVMDQNMSVLEPGIMIPKRVMVLKEDVAEARDILTDAGIAKELEV